MLQEAIGDYNPDFVDSQEIGINEGMVSSFEEPSEDNFDDGEYALEEDRNLEELW